MLKRVLYADDEENYRKLVKMFLENEGYEVVLAKNGEEALEVVETDSKLDLVILDVMMPKMDGWEACREIRKISSVPVLMLTALGDENNEIFGMKNGADEYISKPFSHELFIVRVGALIRRNSINETTLLEDEGITLKEDGSTIVVNNENIGLTPKEYLLLKHLIINKNIVLNRDSILNKIWGMDYFGDPRTLDTHIKILRSKLGEKSSKIATIRNVGYCYRGDKQ